MILRLCCPQGHPVDIAAEKLGDEVACPHCLTTFLAGLLAADRQHARKEERKSRRSRDDDDEDEEDEDEEEEDRPRKKAKARSRDDDDDEDEVDDEDDESDDDEPIEWTPRKRQLSIVRTALI